MRYRSSYEILSEEERRGAVDVLDADGRVLLVMPEKSAREQRLSFVAVAFVLVDRRRRCLAALDDAGRADFLGGRALRPDESFEDAVLDAAGRLAAGALAVRRHTLCRPPGGAGGCWIVPFAIEIPIADMDRTMRGAASGRRLLCRSADWMRVRALSALRPGDMGLPEEAAETGGCSGMTPLLAAAIARGLLESGEKAD